MTARQQRFVEEYLVDLNATQAAIRAGYSPKTANEQGARLLANVSIREAIEHARTEQQQRTQINADWVLKKLVENVERAMQAIPVLDHEGNPTGEYRYEGSVANKALELIGDHVGFFPDKKVQLSGPNGGPIQNEHTGTITVTDRIEALANAFLGAASRQSESDLSGNDSGKPVDS